MTIKISEIVSKGSESDEKSFRTFSNYVHALEMVLQYQHGPPSDMVADLRLKMKVKPAIGFAGHERASMLLRRAWSTEMLLAFPVHNKDLANILAPSTLWLPVQVYYAIYSALQAAYVTYDGGEITHHTAAINAFSNRLSARMPYPLHCSVFGLHGATEYHRFPLEPSKTYSNLRKAQNKYDAMQLLGHALRSTRDLILDERFEKWRTETGRKQMPSTEKARVANNEMHTTLLHFLYRLRIRSNYGDSEVFVTGPSTVDSRGFARAYVNITDYFLGALEVYIDKRIGNGFVQAEARKFVKTLSIYNPPSSDRWDAKT